MKSTITPFLWFDKDAGKIARFYASIFSGSEIVSTRKLHNTPSGTVEIVTMELLGQRLTLMSAGPFFKLNKAVSFVISCKTQKEIDYYWTKLSAAPEAEQCGWLKDKYGLSWQIVPEIVEKLTSDKDPKKAQRVTQALLQMKKIDIAKLKRAYSGK